MHPKDRQKMCTSCDGRIPYDADLCPYCRAEQKGAFALESTTQLHHQSLSESLSSLYTPPYSAKEKPLKHIEPTPPMQEKRFTTASPSLGAPSIPVPPSEEVQREGHVGAFWPTLFLAVGSNLLVLGLLQLLFSHEGKLALEWDSSYWFVYCLSALPLVLFGYKKASTL
ncbi:MAG: hypothetical protein JSS61_04645 [Verrucomicrobia bacterium]|nr:hypothetical protein [Verrucomicrobiota bacterium]